MAVPSFKNNTSLTSIPSNFTNLGDLLPMMSRKHRLPTSDLSISTKIEIIYILNSFLLLSIGHCVSSIENYLFSLLACIVIANSLAED